MLSIRPDEISNLIYRQLKNYEYKTGKGKTRQDAEQSAAKQLLKNLKLVHEKKINSNY